MINYLEGSKTQETPKPNSYVAQEQKLGSKEFTLEFGSKVWKSEKVLIWHRFHVKSHTVATKRKILFLVLETNLQAWVQY